MNFSIFFYLDIEHETNFCIENRKRSVHNQDSSLYNLRGSQALLIELDPNEEDDVEMPVQTESEYYNVQITRIPVGKLWELIEKKRLNGELEKEYEVVLLLFWGISTFSNISIIV